MIVNQQHLNMAVRYVSNSRLRPYKDLCSSDADALELHNEAMLIGSALLANIAMVEIALRNRVHAQIGSDFGAPDWLTTAPNPVPLDPSEASAISRAKRQAQQDRYSKLRNSDKTALDALAFPHGVPSGIKHSKRSKKRQEQITVSEGEVVAHTTLFFWKRFFAPEYEPALWKRSVRKLFPNKTLARAQVSEQIESLYRARNRLAHHEPMYGERLENAISALRFVRENLDTRTPSASAPLCEFTEVQYRLLVDKKTAFDERWAELTSD